MYVRVSEGLGDVYLGPPYDRAKAVKANRQYGSALGWKNQLKRLQSFVNMSRTTVDDEDALADAVADWQNKQSPAMLVDGTIGPGTWSKMRAAGVLKGSDWQNLPCKTTPVTNGEFGAALKCFADTHCVPNDVARLLRASSTFLKIANDLDSKYVASVGPDVELVEISSDWQDRWGVANDGLLTKGTYRGFNVKGRRVLSVRLNFDGSSFSPADNTENPTSFDTIWLQPPAVNAAPGQTPDATELGRWVENIAHESTHAWHRVKPIKSRAATLVGRVCDGIQEESLTRTTEARIISEARATALGGTLLRGFTATSGGTDAATVERDFFPSKLRRTYLEHFMLIGLLGEAITLEKLTPFDIDKKNKEADRISLTGWRDRKFASEYSKLSFWLRVIDFRWRRLHELRQPNTTAFAQNRETILQENANAFFGGRVQYTPPGTVGRGAVAGTCGALRP
jgi:hypothetical protein